MNVLNKLTIKHLTMNKKRTIVTIIGVILSTALMIGIGLLVSSIRDYMVKEVISSTGNYHASIKELTVDNIQDVKEYDSVKKVSYEKGIGFAYLKETKHGAKRYLYINSVDKNFYDLLNLTEGRFPENDNEIVISDHINNNDEVNYQVGDILSLDIGNRLIHDEEILDNISLNTTYELTDDEISEKRVDETLNIKYKKDYEIVGIVERSFTESYDAAGYTVFTALDNLDDGEYKAYIEYERLKDVREKTEVIAKSLGLNYSYTDGTNLNLVRYNESLLSLAGESKYDNFNTSVAAIIVITLSLISIACIMVIYNSFAISVMERKKQFGLFASIGATRRQLKKTVFFEAFIVGVIGIILGLLSALLGIGVVLKIVNHLLSDMFILELDLVIYPLFIVIPIIFMIMVLIISAYLPAKRASRISPIEAIRLNDDIKIKSKKLKTPKIVTKIFGVEGEIALKSIKRNKKKYRITIISLFISIVLFISFSSYINYIIGGSRIATDIIDFDMYVTGQTNSVDNIEMYSKIKNTVGIKNPLMYYTGFGKTETDLSKYYTNNYKQDLKEYYESYENNLLEEERLNNLLIINYDSDNYTKLKKELGIKEDKSILINNYNLSYYMNNNKKSKTGVKFKNISELEFDAILQYYKDEQTVNEKLYHFNDLVELKDPPSGIQELIYPDYSAILIVPDHVFETINNKLITILEEEGFTAGTNFTITFNYDKKEEVSKIIEEYSKKSANYFHYGDIKEEQQMEKNILIVVNILVYGFITLVTLIGVTSVFNTINTSMLLRKKEFAILRSVGLSPKGFNRILQFETLIFGFKSLLYALPVSFGIIYLIHISMGELVGFGSIMIPWKAVIIAVVGVFVIVAITMIYATKKIKQENILEAIREENI